MCSVFPRSLDHFHYHFTILTDQSIMNKRCAVVSIFILLLKIERTSQCAEGWQQSTINPDKCYKVVISKKNWSEAQRYCQSAQVNASLTSIASAFETLSLNAIVVATPAIASCEQMWIGANDLDNNGQFSWSDGHSFVYTNWDIEQPELSNKCVSSKARTTGRWQTEPCGMENCLICENYITVPASSSTTTQKTTTSASTCTPFSNAPALLHAAMTDSLIPMTDCYDWLHLGNATATGIYRISPAGSAPFDVYCDMETDGGGWTVIHKRQDDCLNFWDRRWNDCKMGFNNGLDQNFWLGLDRIHILSSKDADVTLRIDIHGSRCPMNLCGAPANGYWFGKWQGFRIGNESDDYRFHIISTIQSNFSLENDTIIGLNGAVFSTADHHTSNGGCEEDNGEFWGPWWAAPSNACLNGKYDVFTFNHFNGYCVENSITNEDIFPVQSQLKLRRSG